MMKLVIDIDDNIYTRLFDNGVDDPDDPIDDPIDIATVIHDTMDIQTAIRNGTPLPKEHGRLISADSLIKAIEEKAKRLSNIDTINGLCGAVALIFDAPTIVERNDS